MVLGKADLKILSPLPAVISGYLAWFTSETLASHLPRLLLAILTPVEIRAFTPSWVSPGLMTQLPASAPAALYLLHDSAAIIAGFMLLAALPLLARRSTGWLFLFWIQTLLFVGFRLLFAAFFVTISHYGALGWAFEFKQRAELLSMGLRYAFFLLTLSAVFYRLHPLFRRFLDAAAGTGKERCFQFALWFLLPIFLLATFAGLPPYANMGPPIAPSVILLSASLLLGLPAVLCTGRSTSAWQPDRKGAVVVLTIFMLVLSSLFGYERVQRSIRRNANLNEFAVHHSRHLRLHIQKSLLQTKDARSWSEGLENQFREVAGRLGLTLPNPGTDIYLYASIALKLAMTGDTSAFTVPRGRDEIHQLIQETSLAGDPQGDALALMKHAWGEPGSEAIARAIARFAAGNFFGHGLREYAGRIGREEGLYTLQELMGLNRNFVPPLAADALRGAWLERLVQERGLSILLRIFKQPLAAGNEEEFARSLGTSWQGLEHQWRDFLATEAKRTIIRRPPVIPDTFFRRGITLTQQGRRAGYGSEQAIEQLDRFLEMGVNTIALIPQGQTGAPAELTVSALEGSSDESLLRIVRSARNLRLRCVIKPQLVTPHQFPGKIQFSDGNLFRAWFSEYRRWLLHYARLAELAEAEDFVIGTELTGISRHEKEWRGLISDVRAVYSGLITYAAHWGPELEQVPFWDALDYIGLNMYNPLARPGEQPNADSAPMRELQQRFGALSRAYGKKIVFTEVGFPNTETAPSMPWDKGDARVDPAAQRICYEAIFQAFYSQPWFAGLYWWEWPTHGRNYPYYPTYSPIGKPAAEVIREWYCDKFRRPEGE